MQENQEKLLQKAETGGNLDILARFLSLSARPETDGKAVEQHLMTSLAMAFLRTAPVRN